MCNSSSSDPVMELLFVAHSDAVPIDRFPWGSLQWLCNMRLSPGCEQTFGVSEILPGEQNPLHYHPNCEELLFVLQGTGRHSYDDTMVDLKPGSLIRIPAGVRHNLINTGTESLRCVMTFSTGDRQTVFLE